MFSLLAAIYKSKSVFLLKFDLLLRIIFRIFSELGFPPGSLIFKKSILLFFKYLETIDMW